MLPVVVDIARRTNIPPGRLLMPLAYSTLLGGLMTLIGTPPNLLISESLTQNGWESFGMFSFTSLGGGVMVVGVLFVALFARFLLPTTKSKKDKHISQRSLRNRYKLQRTLLSRARTAQLDTRRQDAGRIAHRRLHRPDHPEYRARRPQRNPAGPADHHSRRRRSDGAGPRRTVSRRHALERPSLSSARHRY